MTHKSPAVGITALFLMATGTQSAAQVPRGAPTPRDVLGGFHLGPNAGLGSGRPLVAPPTPRFAPSISPRGLFLLSFPPPGSGFSGYGTGFYVPRYYNPLFPYSSAGFPYGYGSSYATPIEIPEPPRVRPPGPSEPATAATLELHVPPGAEVWVMGEKTRLTGTARQFVSPPLEPGRSYTYDVKARWNEGSRPVEQTRKVRVKAGKRVEVEFY